MYSQRELGPWQSRKWIPEGYLDRNTRDAAYWDQRRGSTVDEPAGDEKGSSTGS